MTLEALERRLAIVEDEVEHLKTAEIAPLRSSLQEIKDDLYGDKERGIKGLVKRFEVVEKFVDKYRFSLALIAIVVNSMVSIATLAAVLIQALRR